MERHFLIPHFLQMFDDFSRGKSAGRDGINGGVRFRSTLRPAALFLASKRADRPLSGRPRLILLSFQKSGE
jgi:hypothetical protein